MSIHSIDEAENNLQQLIDEAVESHQPVTITSEKSNVVLLSEDDWSSIQETLYLLSIPGMRNSIKEGLATPVADCSEDIDW